MPRTDNGRRVVVAGATGYLGKYAVQALQREGWRVRALARDPLRLGDAAIACDEVFTGQATRPETLAGLFVGADAAFSSIGVRHFRRKPTFEEVDFGANATLVAAAAEAGVKRFVFVSILDGQRLRTLSPLIDARERVVDMLGCTGMEAVIVRPTGFFNDMADIFRMATKGKVWLIGSGRTRLNPIHGADLADVIASALGAQQPEAEVAVGGPDVLTQREIAELAFHVLGRTPRFGHVSPVLIRLLARALRPLNRNASAIAAMFSALGTQDAVAPKFGTRRLEEFFRSLLKE